MEAGEAGVRPIKLKNILIINFLLIIINSITKELTFIILSEENES